MNSCPICNHTASQNLFTLNASRAARLIHGNREKEKLNQLSACIDVLWEKHSCSVRRCKYCGFVFADPFLAGNSEFYNLTYGKNFSYPEWKWDYEITFRSLKNTGYDFGRLKVLEIGAGSGFFLDHLVSLGIKKENMYANELSAGGCQELKRKEYTAFQQDLSKLQPSLFHEKIDVIFMFQVLEHMDNPNEAFRIFNSISSEKSVLYLTVPNYYTRSLFDRFSQHLDVPPMHVGRYSKSALSELAEKHGWVVKNFILQPQSYQEKIRKILFAVYERSVNKELTRNIKNKFLGSLVKKIIYTGIVIRLLPLLLLLSSKKYGTSQWVQLSRMKIT